MTRPARPSCTASASKSSPSVGHHEGADHAATVCCGSHPACIFGGRLVSSVRPAAAGAKKKTIVWRPFGPVESGCFSRLTLGCWLAAGCAWEVVCEHSRSEGVSVIIKLTD